MHNTNFPPNTNPHTFSLIAVAVGFACVGDYNANEQNSIGNWLILVGQYILTHAAQQQLIESRIENNNINIGIICVPRINAQKVCDLLVKGGIKGIWNFAPVDLVVPDDVKVENVHLSESLLTLVYLMK